MTKQRVPRVALTPGQMLKELRRRKGWTQAVLARITGMAACNLSNIERGRSRLGEDRAILLAAALGVRPDLLLFPNGFEREGLKPRLKKIRQMVKRLEGRTAA